MKKISLYLVFSLVRTIEKCKPLVSPFLLVHLFECVGDIKRADLFVVLKFEEFTPTVASHIDEDVRPVIR